MAEVQVANKNEIPRGSMKTFTVGNTRILVAHTEDGFHAVDGICTHMGGHLAEGRLDGFVVTCPRHGSGFDVRTGVNVASPKIGPFKMKAADLRSYPLRLEGESIKVAIT
jgi:3-phenylpropionate/trans-cinnamate dioxygenase ferredoxin subunit